MERPMCIVCNKNKAAKRGSGFRKKCDRCARGSESIRARNRRARNRREPWHEHKKSYCEGPRCKWNGPFAAFQLSVDHIDGDRENNDPSNFMTLCHNCHHMKTYENQEWLRREERGKNAWVDVDTPMLALVG